MLVALNVVSIVRAGVSTSGTLNDISGFDLGFTTREVGEENLFLVAVFACEAKIPLSGGKGMHAVRSSKSNYYGREERGITNVPALIRREGFGRQEKTGPTAKLT